jgi:hypothetical protein
MPHPRFVDLQRVEQIEHRAAPAGEVPAASWDIPSITFLKINKGQSFDYHPDLSKEAQAVFLIKTDGGIDRILASEDSNEDGMGFYFYRRLSLTL